MTRRKVHRVQMEEAEKDAFKGAATLKFITKLVFSCEVFSGAALCHYHIHTVSTKALVKGKAGTEKGKEKKYK